MDALPSAPKRPLLVIGWIEHIDLPDLGLHDLRTKIDTGARTSALHATHIQPFEKDGAEWVRFVVAFDPTHSSQVIEAPIHGRRSIKNTSGIPEERIVIRTRFRVAGRTWTISVSLTDRSNMTFPMIVGRSALKNHNIAVHTRRANLARPAAAAPP
ncbi:ATP-dependent zinc protease family protein [Flavimaricola marinus]|uniref:Retropepsin-like aspartic endopeptidase domain-containing protein n=1 Tax=Flavimaricola marinus TaxID=1819565 RepID=A0A238LD08_9RHOB|nr:RimK/LysX family protein [Flavimaricola marinus]SMY07569.1 hypothetical protein LOM8899_01705 [Flavimaricola marinus]